MEKKIRLSIHTATYNRGYIIEQAYKSLQNQTCHDFEWVVTDDGSTDETEELFNKWSLDENKFDIVYNKKENGGIPRALNFGVNAVNGDYFFMLDSDDYLLPDAVEKLHSWIKSIENEPNIVGVGGVRITSKGKPIKGVFPIVDKKLGYVDATNLERELYHLDADMCEAYKVEIIKKYPFQVWENEIYAPEQLCFDEMALDGLMVRWYKDPIYVCEYLEDGQTQGNWNLLKKNKMGYAMLSNHKLKHIHGLKARCKAAAQHIALSIVAGNWQYILKTNDKLITLIAFPYGLALSVRRKLQFNK